jgi:hypothetical protein
LLWKGEWKNLLGNPESGGLGYWLQWMVCVVILTCDFIEVKKDLKI